MINKNLHTTDELIESIYGKIGTPKRDAIEKELKEFTDKCKSLNSSKREEYLKKILFE